MPSSFHHPVEDPAPASLILVARRSRLIDAPAQGTSPRSWLTHWHLLSLDAPSVAALWVAFVGWYAGVRLSLYDPAAMFVAVWILYVADRLLDARPLASIPPSTLTSPGAFPELEQRHHFHHRHRRVLLPCLVAATPLLALLLYRLAAPVLHLYTILASLLAGWLILVHVRASPPYGTRRLPKELAVGLFFPAAVFIPTVARAPALRTALLLPALLFAGICTLNCLFLYAWEHPGNPRRAHASTRAALAFLLPLACGLALGCWGVTIVTMLAISRHAGTPHTVPLAHPEAISLAAALSATALLLLHAFRRRLHPLTLRALADAVLLTPAPVVCWLAAHRYRG